MRERMRQDAITHLEIRDEQQLYRAMSRGELEAKEHQAQRAYAAGPKDVSAELKHTALAEADQRQAAVGAEAQGDEATAKALRSLADLLETQKAALDADQAEHENWSTKTAGLREEGGKARAELARRGQATETRPGETTLEWWQRFERSVRSSNSTSPPSRHKPEPKAGHGPRSRPRTRSPGRGRAEQRSRPGTAWRAEVPDEPTYERSTRRARGNR